MGVDEPKSFVSSLNGGVMPSTRTSGGDKSPLPESVVVKKPYDLTGLADGLNRLSSTIMGNMARQKKEQEALQRNVDFTSLTTQNQMDNLQAYDEYKANYQGNPEDFAAGFMKTHQQYSQTQIASISDPKLKAEYQQFAITNSAKFQLKALQDQQQLQLDAFGTKFQNNNAQLQNLVRMSPDFSTLDDTIKAVDKQYAEMLPLLKAAGQDQTVLKEAQDVKNALATTMVMSQAKDDPDSALASLEDPALRKLVDPTGTQPERLASLTNTVLSIKEHRDAPLIKQAELVSSNYIAALATGKDGSQLRQQLSMLGSVGTNIVSPDIVRKVAVAEAMASRFSDVRNNLMSMSEDQFDRAVAALNPSLGGGPADISLEDQQSFYNDAVAALKDQWALVQKNPESAMSALTGSTDPATNAAQTVAARLRAGADINDIRIMDDVHAKDWLAQIDNGIKTGSVDGVVQVFNKLYDQYSSAGHPERQVAPGVDLLDVALKQLSQDKQHPLIKRMVAAYHMLPKGQRANSQNGILLQAALMTQEQRRNLIQRSGDQELITKNSLDVLDRRLQASSDVWATWTKPSQYMTPEDSQLLLDKKAVMLDAMLLNVATGGYKPTGGYYVPGTPFTFGQTPAEENAINATMKSLLNLEVITVAGNPMTVKNLSSVPSARGTLRVGDPRMYFNTSKLLVPPGTFNTQAERDSIPHYIRDRLTDKEWIFNNVRLPGYNDGMQGGGLGNTIYDKIIGPSEGGYVANDAGMGPTNFGINFTNNQGILKQYGITSPDQMKNLTQAQARDISLKKYYNGSLAERAKDPKLAALLLDINFNGGLGAVAAKVPELQKALSVAPNTPGNVKYLDSVYDQVKAARFDFWKNAKGGSQWKQFGNAWTSRQSALDTKAGDLRKNFVTYKTLDPGKRMLLDKYLDVLTSNLDLTTNESNTGVRILTNMSNKSIPFSDLQGRPLEFSWQEIKQYKPMIGGR